LTNLPRTPDDLSAYRQIIHALAPLVNKSNFKAEFERRTKAIASDTRFLVKMEIKRLAKPCIRSIDLRTIVKDDCRLFQHHGIDHYLNVNGILTFEKLVKRYGEYTFGVYEGVYQEAKQEKERYMLMQKSSPNPNDIALPADKYITPCQDLLNYPIRKQERLNYVVAIELFFSDNSSVHASTLDISINGLRIRLKDHENLHKIKAFEPIKIVFRGLDKSLGLNRESIEYQILNISNVGPKAQIHLYRDGSENTLFDDFVSQLIKLHKHRYKVNLDNVEMAMASKIYEQSFANNTPTLPVFICRDNNDFYFSQFASMNTNNKHILDYWADEKGQQLIGFLLNQNRIHLLLNDGRSYPQMTIYCFNHIKDDKIYFYSATQAELNKHPELINTFFAYGSRKVSWRVYHVTISDVSPQDAYSPSSVPDGINKNIDRLNKALSPRLRSKIAPITNMLSVTDITNEIAQEAYQTRSLHKHNVKLLKAFGHARNKPPTLVESYRHMQKELRRQIRYILRTSVVIRTNTQYLTGVTEDISVSGLKVELDEAFTQRLNSKVEITFTKLQALTSSFELKNLHYRVVHINIDKHVLHLQAVAENEMSIAEAFFSQLISNNEEKLRAINFEEPVAGLSMALRNIHTKNSPQFCTYVEKKPQGYLPAMSTVSQTRAPWMDFLHHDQSLASVNLAWLFQDVDNGQDFINQTLKVLRIDPSPTKTEIFVSTTKTMLNNDKLSGTTIAKWQYEFQNHRARQSFIKNAQNKGLFLAFSVTVNKALKPDLEKIEEELLYLGQHAIHKATYFEERLWDIAGAIFVTDITDDVLRRYKLEP
jgi:hypothetical protein